MVAVENLIRRYARLCIAHPWPVLVVLACVTVLAAWRGTQIELDTDLKSLLPDDAPSVLAIEEARQRRGGSDLFVIAVTSPSPMQTVLFVDALAEAFEDWEEVEYIEIAQDQTFFRDNALLFLPIEDLVQIDENLRRMIRERQGDNNPLFIDLERDDHDEAFDWRDPYVWISPYTLVELSIPDDELDSLFPFLSSTREEADPSESDPSAAGALTPEELEIQRMTRERRELPPPYNDYKITPNGRTAVFTAKLRGRGTDINYARQIYEYAEQVINELDPSTYHPEMRAQVVGAYRSFLEVRAIGRDVRLATMISIGLVLLLLIGFFRNVRSVMIVLVPLLVGIAWTLGLIEVIFHRLNALTAFVFSMLIGMGIDFGIHLYRRAQEEFERGASWDEALFLSTTRTGRALLTATVTTVVSLLMLLFARFDGFREFGIACAAGVAICLLTAVLVAPPLVGAAERIWPTKRGRRATAARPQGGPSVALITGLSVVVAIIAALGFMNTSNVEFEYDFSNLEAPRDEGRIAYGAALGRHRSSAPAVMLGSSQAQMREVHAVLRERLRNDDPLIRGFYTIESVLPGDQEERLERIRIIEQTLDRRAFRNLDGDEGELVDALMALTDVDAFTEEDLPDWARQNLLERDGTFGAMGLLYGDYNSNDARDVREFQESFNEIRLGDGFVRVSSNGFIISDVVSYVQADAKRLGFYVAIGLILVLLIDLRRPIGVLACLIALGSALLITVFLMTVFDIKVGLYNIVILPVVLGVGIDGSIHIYHRYLEEGRERIGVVLKTTGAAVVASSITTAAGFAGLLVVQHKGVITIGALSVAGILASMVAVLTLLPAVLAHFGRVRSVPSTDTSFGEPDAQSRPEGEDTASHSSIAPASTAPASTTPEATTPDAASALEDTSNDGSTALDDTSSPESS